MKRLFIITLATLMATVSFGKGVVTEISQDQIKEKLSKAKVGGKDDSAAKMDLIDRYKPNEFNLKLYQTFPLKLYRSKNDYMIPKKKLPV